VDIDALQILFRAVLAIVAIFHFAEGALPKRGVTWQLPMALHFKEVAMASFTFLAAFMMMIAMDLNWTPGFLVADVGLLVLIEYAVLTPPTNSISVDGFAISGWRIPWKRYLEHDAEPLDGGFNSVRLRYRTWKFMSTKRFIAPDAAVKAIEDRGVKGRTRRRGWAP